MVFLIIVSIDYLAYIFFRSVLLTSRIVIVEEDIHQIYTYGLSTGYFTTQLLVAKIVLAFLSVINGELSGYFYQSRLIFSWLDFMFFFWSLGKLFFYQVFGFSDNKHPFFKYWLVTGIKLWIWAQ